MERGSEKRFSYQSERSTFGRGSFGLQSKFGLVLNGTSLNRYTHKTWQQLPLPGGKRGRVGGRTGRVPEIRIHRKTILRHRQRSKGYNNIHKGTRQTNSMNRVKEPFSSSHFDASVVLKEIKREEKIVDCLEVVAVPLQARRPIVPAIDWSCLKPAVSTWLLRPAAICNSCPLLNLRPIPTA